MKIKFKKPKTVLPYSKVLKLLGIIVLTLTAAATTYFANKNRELNSAIASTNSEKIKIQEELDKISKEYDDFKNIDQVKVNEKLNQEVDSIESTYTQAVSAYEELVKLKERSDKTNEELDELYTRALVELANQDYTKAQETLSELAAKTKTESEKLDAEAAAAVAKLTAPESNAPPGSGYSRQTVATEVGNFVVSMVAADMGSTKVIVDTASDSDCGNECPVLSLAEYVSRNGAYAGVNGSYFCPAAYPSCAGKTNSFDLLAMNHKKTYFNSDNNVYSSNPVVIFGDGYVRIVATATEWGRDTSPTGVLMNYPLLLLNGEVKFGGDDDPKKGSRGGRSFVAKKANSIYIGVVHSATVAESARVMKALGFESAMNLDDGGSTALWSGGYKVGPGRNLPNAILFIRK